MADIFFQRDDGQYDLIAFDATLKVGHQRKAKKTRHPVEGRVFTDHYQPEPAVLVLEVCVTDTPLETPRSHAPNARRAPILVDIPAAPRRETPLGFPVNVSTPGGQPPQQAVIQGWSVPIQRVQEVWNELEWLQQTRRVVDVLTDLMPYYGMLIMGLETEEKPGFSRYTITFEQATFVDTQRVEGVITSIPRAQPMKNLGRVPAVQLEATDEYGREALRIQGGYMLQQPS